MDPQPTTPTPKPDDTTPNMSPFEQNKPDASMPNQPVSPAQPELTSQPLSQAPVAQQPPLENPGVPGSVVDPGEVVPPIVPAQVPPSKKKKWVIAAIIIGAIIVIGGASAAAYVGYFMPRQPKYVLARAVGNTSSADKIKSAHFDGDISIKSDGQTFKGNFKGQTNQNSFEMDGSMGLDVTTLKVDMRAFKDSAAYIKLDGLNGLPEILKSNGQDLSGLSTYIGAINGQWIELDQSLLANLGQDKSIASGAHISDADAQKIENIYRKHPFLDVTKVHADEKVNGADSHHYTVTINRDQLYSFASELKDAKLKSVPEITSDDLKQIKKTNFAKYPVDVWVDKSRTILDQISFSYTEDNTTMTMRIALSDINGAVNVTKPGSSKTLMQVFSEGIGSGAGLDQLFGSSSDSSSAANIEDLSNGTALDIRAN